VLGPDGEVAAGGPLPGAVADLDAAHPRRRRKPRAPPAPPGTVLGADGEVANRSVILDPEVFPPGRSRSSRRAGKKPESPGRAASSRPDPDLKAELMGMNDPNVPR
jgi:hypothetical protein